MGFFSRRKEEKENAKLIEGVSFGECLGDLFDENPDEMKLRRALAYYRMGPCFKFNATEEVPESSKTVYMILFANSSKAFACSNICCISAKRI